MINESKLPFIEALVSLGCYEGAKGAALYDMSVPELTKLLVETRCKLVRK
ncbi:hypothetical protein BSI_12780 [Bacillus inaquosorum KCTC 13429]|uniref:Uncharacterized protein n=1 Tax=Bacillus inaquosorum KCTC 13429 TaxID=1236548 RepID=A0A9W5LK41_9BACI|nr:hypothetical protein [Bacillus inaquosorum]ELS62199.1 hypothetical protein BSI_12780 [Bacillus inaquosorum KCTC 13429]